MGAAHPRVVLGLALGLSLILLGARLRLALHGTLHHWLSTAHDIAQAIEAITPKAAVLLDLHTIRSILQSQQDEESRYIVAMPARQIQE